MLTLTLKVTGLKNSYIKNRHLIIYPTHEKEIAMAGPLHAFPSTNLPQPVKSVTGESNFSRRIDSKNINNATIQRYVLVWFQRYFKNNIEDYSLWEAIQLYFKDFQMEHLDLLESRILNVIQKYYYIYGYKLNYNYGTSNLLIWIMFKTVKVKWNNK